MFGLHCNNVRIMKLYSNTRAAVNLLQLILGRDNLISINRKVTARLIKCAIFRTFRKKKIQDYDMRRMYNRMAKNALINKIISPLLILVFFKDEKMLCS